MPMFISILRLALSFFKIGVIGFGGGSALIPIIYDELVSKRGSMSEDDYLKHTVVANITPGTLPVKLGATCGLQLTNPTGSLLAAYAISLPGVLATVWMVVFFSAIGPETVDYLNYASIGITIFIIYLLLHYVGKTVRSSNFRVNAVICLTAFFLTSGKEVREIAALIGGLELRPLGRPVFDLSMISVMILSFFGIAWLLLTGESIRRKCVGIILGVSYAFLSGMAAREWVFAAPARHIAVAAMVIGIFFLYGRRKNRGGDRDRITLDRQVAWAAAAFLLLPLLMIGYGVVAGHLTAAGRLSAFLADIALSSITSFGGGEAYVAVADSIFVQTGYCPADTFYGRIVPVANALPGPILVKIAAAIGFVWGDATMGRAGGMLLAALCAMLSIGVCSVLALVVLNYYEALRHSIFMLSLKRYILPVICGTLISTSLAMVYESMKIARLYGHEPARTAAIIALCVGITFLVTAKIKINDILLLLCWIAGSMLVMAQ